MALVLTVFLGDNIVSSLDELTVIANGVKSMDERQSGNQQLIRYLNASNVLSMIRESDTVSRVGLAKSLGMGKSTITVIVNSLTQCGVISELGPEPTAIGRKPRSLRLNANWRYVVSIRVDVTLIHIAMINLQGDVVNRRITNHPLPDNSWDVMLTELERLVRNFCADVAINLQSDVLGVALAVPGVVNPETGVVVSRLRHGTAFPVGKWLEMALDKGVIVENDANALCLGERWKSRAVKNDDMLVLVVEDGIGAGIISNGKLVRGGSLGAGQIGHMKVADQGQRCSCGQIGCLESFVSNAALVDNFVSRLTSEEAKLVIEDLGPLANISVNGIVRLGNQGFLPAVHIMNDAALYIGRAITTIINILNPIQVIVGGPLFEGNENSVINRVWEIIQKETSPVLWQTLSLRVLEHTDETFLLGAASKILESAFGVPSDDDSAVANFALVRHVEFV